MIMTLNAFSALVYQSSMDKAMKALEDLWLKAPNYDAILDAVIPAALSSFSHRHSSMHVPKENEYLRRVLGAFPTDE
jgi:hypothetical protein